MLNKFFARNISVCYTLKSDDISKLGKREYSPYVDRCDQFIKKNKFEYYAPNTLSKLKIEKEIDGVKLYLSADSENISQFGLNLPFKFLGKENCGKWNKQLLFNSPFISEEKDFLWAYLTSPKGQNVCVAVLQGINGWKMDYSEDGANKFDNLKILANFDQKYNQNQIKNQLVLVVFKVGSFDKCLVKLSKLYNKPFLDYDVSGGKVGQTINLHLYGKADKLLIKNDLGEKVIPYSDKLTLESQGETKIVPIDDGINGAGITVYAYNDLIDLYKRSMDTVDLDVIENNTDGNLCEHQCWAAATLRFLLKYKERLTKDEVLEYESRLNKLLGQVTETDQSKAIARRTIFNKPQNGLPAYNVYKSARIQEQFFGITLLLDAFKYFGEQKYYDYAVKTTDCLIDNYQRVNGGLFTDHGGKDKDYSSVCCAMIPIVDMANFLKDKDGQRAQKYYDSASRLAEYIYKRNINFPTEGRNSKKGKTFEDGSISCSALALLYYCVNVEKIGKYINRAKKIMDLHDNWVIKTPICQMKNSTLRWWETIWEGDKDGPAICSGHAWTIWRAEADYLYYSLTGDKAYYKKSLNGFITNLSKINKEGKSFAIYNPDMINGGGVNRPFDELSAYKIASKFPKQEDCGLSRYVWIRINDTLFNSKGWQ